MTSDSLLLKNCWTIERIIRMQATTATTLSMARGAHRPDPDNPEQGYHAPFYGAKSKCFAVTARHGLAAPPQPGTSAYTSALRQVRGKGIVRS